MDDFYDKTSPRIRGSCFKKISKLLQNIYWENPYSVLYGYLTHSNDGKKALKAINKKMLSVKSEHPIVKQMKVHLRSIHGTREYNKTKDLFLQLLQKCKFSLNEAKTGLDITLSSKKWSNIRSNKTPKKRGKKALGTELTDRISQWTADCTDDSIIRKTVQTVRRTKNNLSSYKNVTVLAVPCCFKCLHQKFIADPSNSKYAGISYHSFLRKIPKNVKKAKKKTDLCELCLSTHAIEQKKTRGDQLTPDEEDTMKVGAFHKANALKQRLSFKKNVQELKEGQAVIVFDFKQNIKLGGSPEEVSQDYYHTSSINYISFFVKTPTKGIFFDFSSEVLAKDAYFVRGCLRKLFKHPAFKELKINELIAWSDVGKHFRNGMLAYFFSDLTAYGINKVTHNFFVESHGKSICDVHFSRVMTMKKIVFFIHFLLITIKKRYPTL